MSFTALRESRQLSQEMLAQVSGLSRRTIQRLEAGHRVSYASLRALAVALDINVDAFERKLYAVDTPGPDFIEVPRWVRRLSHGMSYGGPAMSRCQAFIHEGMAIGLGVLFLIASWWVAAGMGATTLRVAGVLCVVCGYAVSVIGRVMDHYHGWPATQTEGGVDHSIQPTLKRRVVVYVAAMPLALLFLATVLMLVR